MCLHQKKIILFGLLLFCLTSCTTINNTTSVDTIENGNIMETKDNLLTESTKTIRDREDSITMNDNKMNDEELESNTYLESSRKAYYVGDCSSDTEAIEKLDKLLQLEEEAQAEVSGYDEVPVCNDFYVVLDKVRDDSLLMEKMYNNEVDLIEYLDLSLNGRKVNIIIVRYL